MSAAPTSTRQPSNWLALALSLVPGCAQWYLEHYLLGAVHFVAFVTALNGVFLGATLRSIEHATALYFASLAALAVVWVLSVGHAYRHSFGLDRRSLAENRELLLRTALIDYLRDELEGAARKLDKAIELDVDWLDPDPLFHLGVVMLRLAERHVAEGDIDAARGARRRSQWAFRTCLARDPRGKWRGEIGRESLRMQRLLGRSRGTSARLDASGDGLESLMRSGTSLEALREQRESARLGAQTGEAVERTHSRRAPRQRAPSRRIPHTRSYQRPEPPAPGEEPAARTTASAGPPRTRITPRPYDKERLEATLAQEGAGGRDAAADAEGPREVVVVDPALEVRPGVDDPIDPGPARVEQATAAPAPGARDDEATGGEAPDGAALRRGEARSGQALDGDGEDEGEDPRGGAADLGLGEPAASGEDAPRAADLATHDDGAGAGAGLPPAPGETPSASASGPSDARGAADEAAHSVG